MHPVKALCGAVLLLTVGIVQAQETSYTFQGPAFDAVSGSYTAGQNVSGSITLSEPVPPNTSMSVTPILVSYSFSDGVVTLDDTNSEIIAGINLTTDSVGSVESYAMTFWESPLATSAGDVFTGMDIFFDSGNGALGCTPSATCSPANLQINSGDLECLSVSGGVCDLATQPPAGDWGRISRIASQTGFNPGFDDSTWSGGPPPRPVPSLGSNSLMLLMLMLAAVGAGMLYRRTA